MKKIILYILFLSAGTSVFAQEAMEGASTSAVQFRRNKNNDQVLPHWAIDVNYKIGTAQNKLTMVDLTDKSIPALNTLPATLKSTGLMQSGGIQLSYFFGKNKHLGVGTSRQFGIGTGLSWYRQTFDLQVDLGNYSTQYQSTDRNGNIFRQKLTNTQKIEESLVSNSIVIPLLLKYKHQFKNSNFGIAANVGALIGISNPYKTKAVAGKFDYEAIYAYDNGNEIFDTSANVNGSETSHLILKDFWSLHQTSDTSVEAYFTRKNNEGMNVGLNKDLVKPESTSNPFKTSLGFVFEPSLTYYLGYHTTFMLGAYYMYQVNNRKGSEQYRLTDKVGEYNSIVNGASKNVIQTWGLNLGVRFFFGEKRDLDDDKIADVADRCKDRWGLRTFEGCPDSDGDGVMDDYDDCPSVQGTASGCPDADGDGVKDDEDACPEEPGVLYGDPKLNGCSSLKIAKEILKAEGLTLSESKEPTVSVSEESIESYFDILQTHVINFDFGKSAILPSNYIALDEAADILSKQQEIMIIVSGHTDSVGTYSTNMKLSFNRANAVSDYLQKRGVSKDRIIAVGYGKEKPITSNNVTETRALNRRTEMMLVKPIKQKK